jgi:hypothetical protein
MEKEKFQAKLRIQKLKKRFIRDSWGNISKCFWNSIIKEEIIKLEEQLIRPSSF